MVDLGMKAVPVKLLSGEYIAAVCDKGMWENICAGRGNAEMCRTLINGDIPPASEVNLFFAVYTNTLKKVREQVGLEVPYYPAQNEKDDVKYTVYTRIDKLVADYANMDIYAIDRLSILDYWLLERDAFISALSMTEKGREYLNNAYRITQTEADEDLGVKADEA